MSSEWLFVSDLHLGDGTDADDFQCADMAFRRFLMAHPNAGINVLGDFMELGQANIYAIARAHRDLLYDMAMRGADISVQPGNHDFPLRYLSPIVPWRTAPAIRVFSAFGKRILTLHGHQFDRWNRDTAFVGRVVTRAVGWLERRGWSDIDRKLSRLRHGVVPQMQEVQHYDNACAMLARRHQCEYVIHGHDHMPHTKFLNGVWVFDTGTWTRRFESGYPYVRLDADGIRLEFWRWQERA